MKYFFWLLRVLLLKISFLLNNKYLAALKMRFFEEAGHMCILLLALS
jgi:hypothetical protein